jgi:hypothetical protein
MLVRIVVQGLLVAVTLMSFCSSAIAEKVVYKWVDADGVVHFGDAPPDEAAMAEAVVIPKSPPANVQPPAIAPATATTPDAAPAPIAAEMNALYKKTDISKLSIADLDLRCDEAREKMIAPLREAEIEKCKEDKREDPAFCERFNADFGESGRTVSGSIRPRMFDDLTECVDAKEELNRRAR